MMYYPSVVVFAFLSFAAGGLADSSQCYGPQYNTIPGFGAAKTGGCYPTGYFQTSDLGQTNPTDAQSRCQQKCGQMGYQCGSVVAQVNKAADSNLYSGTCFYYSPENTPVSPRRCADGAYLLQAYKKDDSVDCFSASGPAATAFCSSFLGIPMNTVLTTITVSAPQATITNYNTIPAGTVTITSVITPTATVSDLSTVTNTGSAKTVTVSTLATTTFTSVVTLTSTVTASASTDDSGYARRAATTVPPPACISSDTPASRLSAACTCNVFVNKATTTKTITSTKAQTTVTLSSTVTGTVASTVSVIVTAVPTMKTITGTVTTSINPTITTTLTNYIAVTTTVTTTTTTTVGATGPTCTTAYGFYGPSSHCSYNRACSKEIYGGTSTQSTVTNEDACFTLCDSSNTAAKTGCKGYTFFANNNLCQIFSITGTLGPASYSIDSVTLNYCSFSAPA